MERRDDKRPQITEVIIFGRGYSLCTDESPDYTRKVSDLVDRKMSEIAAEHDLTDPAKVAIVAAMDIADQVLKLREQRRTGEERAVDALQRLGRYLDDTDGDEDAQSEDP